MLIESDRPDDVAWFLHALASQGCHAVRHLWPLRESCDEFYLVDLRRHSECTKLFAWPTRAFERVQGRRPHVLYVAATDNNDQPRTPGSLLKTVVHELARARSFSMESLLARAGRSCRRSVKRKP